MKKVFEIAIIFLSLSLTSQLGAVSIFDTSGALGPGKMAVGLEYFSSPPMANKFYLGGSFDYGLSVAKGMEGKIKLAKYNQAGWLLSLGVKRSIKLIPKFKSLSAVYFGAYKNDSQYGLRTHFLMTFYLMKIVKPFVALNLNVNLNPEVTLPIHFIPGVAFTIDPRIQLQCEYGVSIMDGADQVSLGLRYYF